MTCPDGHSHSEPAAASQHLFRFNVRDLAMTQAIHGPDITTTQYMTHFIPRRLMGQSHNGTTVLHNLPSEACRHADCSHNASISSIKTSWPPILHLLAETFTTSTPGGSVTIEPAFSIPDGKDGVVTYQLVGRIIYQTNHFVSEINIAGHTYYYDDMKRNGTLQETSPPHIRDMPFTQSIFLVYNRSSDHQVRLIFLIFLISNMTIN